MKIISSIFVITLALQPLSAIAGKVTAVLDGDTLEILEDGKAVRVRLANIDAPEKSQPYGQASKKSLSDLCFGKDAQLKKQSIDQYGRTVGIATCAGIEANRVQVERGMAWVYVAYNRDPDLINLQNKAKSSRQGLWQDTNPMPPWDYRHAEKPTHSATSDCMTGPRGGRYRLVNGHKQYGCV